jgi:peptidoglycan/xylan/chitin deacetylase (PgdA/CDA1 family)
VEQRPDPDAEPSQPSQPVLGRRAVLTIGLTGISGVALAGCSAGPGAAPDAGRTSGQATQHKTPSGTSAPSTATSPHSQPTSSAQGNQGPPAVALSSGPDITHGPRTGNSVALTFHGQGPESMARDILDACARAHAAVTVFAVGTWLHQYPHVGREVVAAGHELGNHTWSHQQMKQLSPAQAVDEAVRGAKALEAAVGSAGWWFRPSGTQHSTATIRAAAAAAGYHRCVSYDVDPEDFRDPGAQAVRTRTLAAVRAGSIVSLHFGHQGTVDALPGILAGLRDKGLQAVTLSNLMREQ